MGSKCDKVSFCIQNLCKNFDFEKPDRGESGFNALEIEHN